MELYPDLKEEYSRRDNELWPEMRGMLKEYGAISYPIFFDPKTDYLLGFLEIENEEKWAETTKTEINQKWWDFMADIMETNPDNSPVVINLEQIFEL